MTKSETREMAKLFQFRDQLGANDEILLGIAARTISALIRSSRSTKSSDSLWDYADSYGVRNHPEFIC